jgi:Mn2+/Fe2+ NRAMP family transporter
MKLLARILGFMVVGMGIVFMVTAILLKPDIGSIVKNTFIPSLPAGSSLLILALVGTTVVPYNLFLGSGIADKTQAVGEMRFGISTAVILGGAISMAVLVVGTSLSGVFSFEALGSELSLKLGGWAVWFFGFGLFAAGFSSAVTAPLASALTAGDLFRNKSDKWQQKGIYFKLTWGFVLATGLLFGSIGLKPIPAIIAAQALNGLILPFVSIFLWFAVNSRALMGDDHLNSVAGNLLFGLVVWITLLLGTHDLMEVLTKITGSSWMDTKSYYTGLLSVTFLLTLFFYYRINKKRL